MHTEQTDRKQVPANLEAARRLLAARLLAERAGSAGPALVRRDLSNGTAPLSFAQERLWLADRLAERAEEYYVPLAMRISGPFDGAVLRAALEDLMTRHEVLRTTYESQDGVPVQRPHDQIALDFAEADLTASSESERQRRYAEDSAAPFDLSRDAPLRGRLYRLGPDEHALVVVIHHIAADGWTIGLLFADLCELYTARAGGREADLRPLAVQYADYAVWQRERLTGPRLDDLLAFWTAALAGAPQVLELPLDHARPARRVGAGAFHREAVDQETARQVLDLARTLRVTPFTVLLSLWRITLWHHTGQRDVLVGVPVAGRGNAKVDQVAGCFLNMLPLRGDLSGDPTVRELAGREHRRWLDTVDRQELPFERLVEELRPERTPGVTPVFQTTFSHRSALPALPAFPGTDVVELVLDGGVAQYDLALDIVGGADGMRAVFGYDEALFDERTVAGLAGRFVDLLRSAVRTPDQPISRLLATAAGERDALLRRGGPDPAELADVAGAFGAAAGTLTGLLASVSNDLDATAVADRAGDRSHRWLNAFSSRLAHRLHALGVGPGDRVAVLVDRRAELPGVLLAIAKTGAAWVPLDPAHPAERLAYILEDCGARAVVLGGPGTVPPGAAGLPSVHIDRDAQVIADGPDVFPPSPSHPDSPAYVIYTSGSTGRPKGVEVSHRSLVQLLLATISRLQAGPEFGLVAVSTIAFDVAAFELLMPLACGGRVYVADGAQVRDGRELARVVEGWNATAVHATPSVWRSLKDSGWEGSDSVIALCGGEAMPADMAPWLLSRFGEVWNNYGPTETAIFTTMHRLTSQTLTPSVPLGMSLAHARVVIVDERLNLVPPGAVGELCVAGPALAHGYVGRPGLTADRFVPDPFGPPGSRLYRTGDLARWTVTGDLAYLGRNDHQIKVRGFRIEIGEVETVLTGLPGIAESVVVGRIDAHGDGILVGYVVPEDPAGFRAEDLRTALRTTLPDYMVPSLLIAMESFPLSPTGKIDRAALPEAVAPADGDGAALEGAVQELIGEIWSELLGVPAVPADRSFFDIGGHSLSAARLAFRLDEAFGIRIELRELFERQTVVQQATLVEELILAEIVAMDEDVATELLRAGE